MSNVSLEIGGRTFTVACADGEEAHVARLGRMIHDKVAAMGGTAQKSESRMLLFAALLLADELSDQRDAAAPSPAVATEPAADSESAIAARLDAIARRIENLADRLEG